MSSSPWSRPLLGWLTVAATAVAYDAWAVSRRHQTLSWGFRTAARHRWGRWLVLPTWAMLTYHLATGWPGRQ